MLGSNFSYDGTTIPTYKSQSTDWIAENIKWATPVIQNSQINKQDFHGIISNPTFARARLIIINGKIFSTTKTGRGSARNTVDNLFQIDNFPAQNQGFKTFAFTDDDGVQKFINAKVYSRPEYDNGQGDAIIDFSVELLAQDPLIRSINMVSQTGNYGFFGGVLLSTTLPISFDSVDGEFTATNDGNFASPCKITINDEIVNPKILNMTTGRFFKLNISMNTGDELVIDSEERTAKLNGTSVMAYREDGSNWIFANPGQNTFVLLGDDYDATNLTKVSIKVDFYSAWL